MSHPAILEAAVVAVPDGRYGELVGAWVVKDERKPALSREEVRRTVATGMNPQVSARAPLATIVVASIVASSHSYQVSHLIVVARAVT